MNMGNPLHTPFAMDRVSKKQRGTASALMQMSWQGTRAISALGSGVLQEASGFACQKESISMELSHPVISPLGYEMRAILHKLATP